MQIVVVGATGNVGTSVVESLAGAPEVTSILGLARRLPDWSAPKTEWASADIASDDVRPQLRGADAVVLLAWLFQPTHDPRVTWRTNVLGSIRVLQALADARVPTLVYASSIAAYSPGPKDRRVDETWPTHGWPTAAYPREKAYVERVLDSFEHEHPELRIVRMRQGFVFKRESATQQRRLFAGPLLPTSLVRPGLIPVFPDLPSLQFQAMHSSDVGEAYRLAVLGSARGAFNLAAEPVLDTAELAALLGARPVRIASGVVRGALAAGWHAHVVPASPQLFDSFLHLPVMDIGRARKELGWSPHHSAVDAVREFLAGLREGAGMATPPLAAASGLPNPRGIGLSTVRRQRLGRRRARPS
jgi:nucleoside-diphosphate-sugar epimerase